MKRLLLCAALLAWSGLASAVVYKWVDAQGKVQYGDRPPDGVHAEVVELYATHSSRTGFTRAAAETPAPPAAARASATREAANAQDDPAKKAVQQEVADVRDKQCAEAQAKYKQYIESRRLYKTGENGERVYLTAEEIDTERVNAKRDADAICGSTS
jgi:Domain of unknown function (DUF4124)